MMKLGLYDAILHDRSLPDAIRVVADVGLTGLEISTGGFLPAVHVAAFDDILVSDTDRDVFLGVFEGTGVSIAGLNANEKPLHPDRLPPGEPRTNLGGDEWANEWPKDSARDFVALGKGHDIAYWTEFLRALYEVDPDMLVNIEHEDTELGRVEGVTAAAEVLKAADARLRESLESSQHDEA